MSLPRSVNRGNRSFAEGLDDSNSEAYLRIIRALGTQVINPGDGIDFKQLDREGIFIPVGEYGGFTASGSRQSAVCAPGAIFDKQIVVSGSAIISGAILNCERNIPAIVVSSSGRLILSGSHISKSDDLQAAGSTNAYILVEAGGFASINGCVFHGDQSDNGSLVYHADAVNTGRVAVVGSMNLTDVITTTYVNVGYTQDVP